MFRILVICFLIPFSLSAKIYDCFLFFKELEILEIRLNEMAPYVDKFVIVESCETFQGQSKALIFAENQQRFDQFKDKIIYVSVLNRIETDNPWLREHYQRNQISRGLAHCHDEDVIFISDCDEIVRGSIIPRIAYETSQFPYICGYHQNYSFYLNRHTNYVWPGVVATKYAFFKQHDAQYMREVRAPYCLLENIGWHFSYMGGLERVNDKLQSFSHKLLVELAFKRDKITLPTYDCARPITNDQMRKIVNTFRPVPIDETYPKYVQDHLDYFLELGFIDTDPTYNPNYGL